MSFWKVSGGSDGEVLKYLLYLPSLVSPYSWQYSQCCKSENFYFNFILTRRSRRSRLMGNMLVQRSQAIMYTIKVSDKRHLLPPLPGSQTSFQFNMRKFETSDVLQTRTSDTARGFFGCWGCTGRVGSYSQSILLICLIFSTLFVFPTTRIVMFD